MKKTTPPSKAMLTLARSLSFNAQNYIPKGGVSFSLFKVEILSGLTVALALVPEAIAFAFVAGVAHKYNSFGKKIKLRHLTKDCHKLLSQTGQLVVDSDNDPDYSLAVDYGVKLKIFGK